MHHYQTIEDPRRIIRSLMTARGFKSARELSGRAGVPQSSLSRYLAGTAEDMEMATWRSLADVLNVTVSQLLGEVPIHQDPSVQSVVRAMERLPEERRGVVAETVASLSRALTLPKSSSS